MALGEKTFPETIGPHLIISELSAKWQQFKKMMSRIAYYPFHSNNTVGLIHFVYRGKLTAQNSLCNVYNFLESSLFCSHTVIIPGQDTVSQHALNRGPIKGL